MYLVSCCLWMADNSLSGSTRLSGVVFRNAMGQVFLVLKLCVTASTADLSLSPNQLHEGFNLLRNSSAVGAEILL
jgi:hypothetical protein